MCKKIDELMEENAKLKEALARVEAENEQPAAGEPVAWIVESPEGCERVKSVCDSKLLADRYESLGWAVTAVFAAPPAAAHGDEAVRRDAERYRWVRAQPGFANALGYDRPEAVDWVVDAILRAQAREGGEV